MMEEVLVAIFVLGIAGAAFLGFVCLFAGMIMRPICNCYIRRSSRKLEWRAVETDESRKSRAAKSLDKPAVTYTCYLQYRVVPEQLSVILRAFGENDWVDWTLEPVEMSKEEDFKEFVANFKTYGDVCEFVENRRNKVLWTTRTDK